MDQTFMREIKRINTNTTFKGFSRTRIGEFRKKFSTSGNENATASSAKIEILNSNDVNFFEKILSADKLMTAWVQLKSNPGFVSFRCFKKSLNSIDSEWFKRTSEALINGKFAYSNRKRIHIPKSKSPDLRSITISNPRVKIIEKALLNALELYFEGLWEWEKSTEKKINKLIQKNFIQDSDYKKNEEGWFLKKWIQPRIFSSTSHGFRSGKSPHTALKSIKEWSKNVVWLLDYDIKKTFDNVHRKRLRNIFLSHINQPRVWSELEKMMNSGIIDVNLIFEKKGVAQGSVISPFLFNIYMNELDSFMSKLMKDKSVPFLMKDMERSDAMKKYKKIKAEFSNNRVHTALHKYGSVENVSNELQRQLKEYYKAYGRHYGINTKTRNIFYTRYADDFVIGVVGPKSFAIEIRTFVNNFIKSDLHLDVSKCQLMNKNSKGIKFLGYLIYLPTFSKKVRTLPTKIQAIKKYKKRVLARFRMSDQRLAKAAFYVARSSLLSVYKAMLKSNGDSWSKPAVDKASKSLLMSFNQSNNPALERWIKSFRSKASKEMFFASTFYMENLRSLPDSDESSNTILKKIKLAKEKFLNELNSIYFTNLEDVYNERKEKILKVKAKLDNSRSKAKISEVETVQLSNVLTRIFLKKTQARNVSIMAPLSDICNDLRTKGFFHPKKNRPCGNKHFLMHSDAEIIRAYSAVMHGLLSYYRAADNFNKVKSLIAHLRKSCVFTLARKHNKSKAWAYKTYGDDVTIEITEGFLVGLPSRDYVSRLSHKFLIDESLTKFNMTTIFDNYKVRLSAGKSYFSRCSVKDCINTNIEIHPLKKLQRKIDRSGRVTVLSRKGKRVTGLAGILTATNRKQLPLCKKHHAEFESGKYSDLDVEYLASLYRKRIPDSKTLNAVFNTGSFKTNSE